MVGGGGIDCCGAAGIGGVSGGGVIILVGDDVVLCSQSGLVKSPEARCAALFYTSTESRHSFDCHSFLCWRCIWNSVEDMGGSVVFFSILHTCVSCTRRCPRRAID